MMTTKLLFHFWQKKVFRGSQIRRIEWVFDNLESTVDVCDGVLSWWKNTPLLSFPRRIGLFSPVAVSEDQHNRLG